MGQGDAPNASEHRRLLAAICQLMPHWQASQLAGFRYLPDGYSNDNYRFAFRGGDYVLRLPLASREPAQWRTEHALYEAPGALRIPSLVAMNDCDGTMITRWVAGELLPDAVPSDAQLVAHTQRLHQALAPHAPLTRAYDPIALGRRQLAIAPKAVPRTISATIQSARWRPKHLAICHNDLNPWNVIAPSADVRTWVTLDWEHPGANDPVFDFVSLHQGLERAMGDVAPLAEQLVETPVTARRIAENLRGFWLREYCWAFAAWHRGNRREAIAAQMSRAEAKLSALAG